MRATICCSSSSNSNSQLKIPIIKGKCTFIVYPIPSIRGKLKKIVRKPMCHTENQFKKGKLKHQRGSHQQRRNDA